MRKLKLLYAVAVLSLFAHADEWTDSDDRTWSYSVSPGGATITGVSPATGQIVIPSEINGTKVTSIGHYAFEDCRDLTGVTIPDGVTSIGDGAFYFCDGLTSVTIPNSVTSIGMSAFFCCSGLTSVTIPNGVKFIGEWAFSCCGGLTSLTIPSSVTSVGPCAFCDCYSLTNVTICSSFTSFDFRAFEGCYNLMLIYIPEDYVGSMECFPTSATIMRFKPEMTVSLDAGEESDDFDSFVVSYGSTYGDLPVPSREGFKFAGWMLDGAPVRSNTVVSALDDHTLVARWWDVLANGLLCEASNGTMTVMGLSSEATELVIPSTVNGCPVSAIASNAFYNCSSLSRVVIPGSVWDVREGAFANCAGLRRVEAAKPLQTQFESRGVFNGCSDDLEIVYFSPEIRNVAANSRYPWMKVGVSFEVVGDVSAGLPPDRLPSFVLSLTDQTTGTKYVSRDYTLRGDTGTEEGMHHVVWNLDAQGVDLRSDEVVFSVAYSSVVDNIVYSGESDPVTIDLRVGRVVDLIPVSWDASWVGGDASATVVIADNGVEIKRTTGVGKLVHTLSDVGRHELTYTTIVDGVAQDEVYTATFFKDWKYEVRDGGAVIIGMTQTEGDVVIPSDMDGYSVTGIEGTFVGCGEIKSITLPSSISHISAGSFVGCDGLTNIVIESDSIAFCHPGLKQAKFNTRFDTTSTLDDSDEVADVSGVIAAYQKVTGSPWQFTDPETGDAYAWNESSSTFAYFGEMYMEEGKTYVFGAHFDDDVYVKVDGQVLINIYNSSSSTLYTGNYLCTTSGWYDVEFRLADNYGGKGSWGNKWGLDFGLGYRDDGGTSATQSEWKKLIDPGDGSLLRCRGGLLFGNCPNLKSITIPCKLVTQMCRMFPDSYDKLETITLTGEPTEIPDNVFDGCAALRSIEIPSTVTKIGASAFAGCSNLTEVVIPKGVWDVGGGAFANCTGLRRVEAAKGLQSAIESRGVFDGCSEALEIVYISPEVRNVTAKQRYPWNGKVDVSFEVVGDVMAGLSPDACLGLSVSATDRTTGSNYVASASALSGDMGTAEGMHHVVWDLNADGIEFKSDDVVFSVAYKMPSLYCVIDLSSGANAASYPVSYLSDVPAGGWTDEYKTTKLVLRRIEPGEIPTHDARITKPFYIGVFEITVAQWNIVMSSAANPTVSDMRAKGSITYNDVRGASVGSGWPNSSAVDTTSFLGRLREKVGMDFDLPTEAQWEYACRAGTTSAYNNGGDSEADLATLGRYSGNQNDGRGGYSGITVVGSYAPNAWGLYDMHGNVWEWSLDWYPRAFTGSGSSSLVGIDPVGASAGSRRVTCGGSYKCNMNGSVSSIRYIDYPSRNYDDFGFRLARTISEAHTEASSGNGEICSGNSAPVSVDLRKEPVVDSVAVSWDASWVGGDSDARVVIADNGAEIRRATGTGEFMYTLSEVGRHELTYTTLVDEVAQDVVYSATLFKDWKYEVRDGGAVIVDTTCKTGDVIVPLDLDGYPVVGIEGAFVGCSDIASVSMQGSPEGYSSFIGWFTEKTGGQQATIETIVTDATVVYPRWTANEYEVSFDAAGGVIDGASGALGITRPVTYDAEYGELPAATREGYTFVGWALNGEEMTADTVVKTANDHTLVAQWTANEYTVAFDPAGGVIDGAGSALGIAQPATYDAVYGELPTASCDGYVFLGWTLDGVDVTGDAVVKTAANHTLTAKWGIQIGNGIWAATVCDEPITLGEPLVPPSGEVVVPVEIAGRPVVGITAAAFAGNEAVTGVAIPASVIGNVEVGTLGTIPLTVVIDDDTQYISEDVKAKVRRVVFGEGVTKIEDNFFDGCQSLETFDIAESVVRIGTNVFEAANALETEVSNGLMLYQGWCLGVADEEVDPYAITIPGGVRGIAAGAFEDEWEIETVKFPSTLRFVGAGAFRDCTGIEGVALPEGVVAVDHEAFRNCTYVEELSLPTTLKEIGDGAFANCTMLTELMIPDGVVDIGDVTFSNCWRVTSVAIPASVTNMGVGAFASCRRITSVTVPLGLATMQELFPAAYDKITSVAVASGEQPVQMVPGIFRGCTALKGIVWPEGLTEIAEEAFVGCASMASFDLPDTVTNIGARAFKDLAQLTEIVVPGSVVGLGEEAFMGCSSLASVSLSRRLTALPDGVFAGCSSLEEVIVPESVTSVGNGAFSGCTQLQAVRFVGNAPVCTAAAYDGAPASLVTYAAKRSRGWDGIPTSMALPEFWPDGTEREIWSWNPSRFTVSFDMNDGMSLAIEVEQVVGTTFMLPTDVDEVVGKFCGWWTASDGGTRMTESVRVASAESYTAYAHWAFNTYSVKFDANGGDGEMEDQLMTVATRTNLLECAYSRLAYTFVGWAVEPDGEVVYSDADEVVNLASGQDDVVTLYAKWSANRYSVTFDAVDDVKTVTFDAEYGELPTATRTGYAFNGWKLDDELVTSDMVVKTANDHTLVAQWTANEYTVTFDANGGSVSGPSVTVTYGAAYGELPTATWTGHSFAGWWTAAEGGIQVAVEDIVNVAADHTLYAQWNISFGDTYWLGENHWQDGWIERVLDKTNLGYMYTPFDNPSLLRAAHLALFEVVGAESKDEIHPVVENLGFKGTLKASVLTDEELRQKVMPPISTVGDWEVDGRWVDLRDADDLSGPGADYWDTFAWHDGYMYYYETDSSECEWPIDVWPDNKSDASRFWVAVECTSSETNRWYGVDGSCRVWQAGSNVKSEQIYVTYSADETWPCLTDATDLFRGVTINAKFAICADVWEVAQTSYNTPLHDYWVESSPSFGSPLSLTLPEAGILYLGSVWFPQIEDIRAKNADGQSFMDFSYEDPDIWQMYDEMGGEGFFYEYGTHPYGWPGYLAIEVSSARTITLEREDEDDDYDFNRLQFFPSSSKSVAVEASYYTIFDRNRCQRYSGGVGEYLQGYVTGTGVYKVGETVALNAVSAPGEAFDHWELKYGNFPSGIDTTKPTLSFTVTDECAGTAEERKQMVVRAVWKEKCQIVATSSDITEGCATGSGLYHEGDVVVLNAVPAAGYEFVAWSDGVTTASRTVTATGEDEQYCAHFAVSVGGQDNVTVTMRTNWDATDRWPGIVVDMADGTTAQVAYGQGYDLPVPTAVGYVFSGWYDPVANAMVDTSQPVDITSDRDFWAQWTAASTTITLMANPNGELWPGIDSSFEGGEIVKTVVVGYGQQYPEFPVPVSSGYVVSGWYDSTDGSYIPGATPFSGTVGLTGDHVLWAQWTANRYMVTFDANGGEGAMAPMEMTVAVSAALPACGFARADYTFAGWAKTPDGEVVYADAEEVVNLAHEQGATIVLYAKWSEITYAVTFDAAGGSGGSAPVAVAYGAALPPVVVPTRAGYTFGGYWLEMNGDKTQYYGSDGTVLRTWDRRAAATLTARWTANTVAYTYYASESDDEIVLSGYSGTVPADVTIPSKIDGKTVVGIGESFMEECEDLVSLTFPSTIRFVGEWAFNSCVNLNALHLNDGLETVGVKAFRKLRSLTSLVLPSTLREIGEGAFTRSNEGVVAEGRRAGISSLSIRGGRNNWFSISGGVLYDKANKMVVVAVTGMSGISVPQECEKIGKDAFLGCHALRFVLFPDSLMYVAEESFAGCVSLVALDFSGTALEAVGEQAFCGCPALATAHFPATLATIGANIFGGDNSLTSVTFDGNAPVIQLDADDDDIEMNGNPYAASDYVLDADGDWHYTGLIAGITTYVNRDTAGWWPVPGMWQGCPVRYVDEGQGPASTVQNVVAQQRYPRNGKVDVTFEVVGDLLAGLSPESRPTFTLSAVDRRTGLAYVAEASALSGDTGTTEGEHHVVWDLTGQGIKFTSDDVVFTVAYETPPLYCVIDLTEGSLAGRYPVTYASAPPTEGWTDACKTTKLVLRRIEPGEIPTHDARITKPFYIGVFEVTQKQYEQVTGSNPSQYTGDMRPVERVSWNAIRGDSSACNWPSSDVVDANSFVGRIRTRTGLVFDLPTAAQWEYACRAGTTSAYNNGGDTGDDLNLLGRYGNNLHDGKGGYSQHTTVGSYQPNSWGLYDMHGNIWEWCLDWRGGAISGDDPTGPSFAKDRVFRGGSWFFDEDDADEDESASLICASSFQECGDPPHEAYPGIGFRLAGVEPESTNGMNLGDGGNIICSADAASTAIDMGLFQEVAIDADAATVNAAVDGVGFADDGVKAAIGGSAAEYAAFKEWAGSVKGAGSAGASAAGEAAVVANTNAAAAYLLGAERLFKNAPVVEIGEVVVGERTSGTGGSGETGEAGGTAGTGGSEGTGTSISVTVTVKDGEEAVKCAAEKVKSMFEATGDLGDWAGEAKMLPTVTVEEDDGSTMRFKVTSGDGTAPRAFLRIRK